MRISFSLEKCKTCCEWLSWGAALAQTREPGRLEAPSRSMAGFAPLGPREPDFAAASTARRGRFACLDAPSRHGSRCHELQGAYASCLRADMSSEGPVGQLHALRD